MCDCPGNAVNTAPLYRLPFATVFSTAIFAAALGFAVFAEVPGPTTILGAAIIVASTLYIGRRAARAMSPGQVGPTLPQ